MPLRPFIAAVALLCCALGTSPAHAQQPAALSPAELDRIRREILAPADTIFVGPIRADYRVRVEEEDEDLNLKIAWIYDDSVTPGYVRPWYPIYHYEMQSMMLPKAFRAHLYPIGIPTGEAISALRDAFRKRKAREAKTQVQAEVDALKKSTPTNPP